MTKQQLNSRFIRPTVRWALLVFVCYAGDVFAVACDAIFTNGAQSHSASGRIDAEEQVEITGGSRDLDTPELDMAGWGNQRAQCGGRLCRETGVPAAVSSPAFQSGSGNDGAIDVGWVESRPEGDYEDVNVNNGAYLVFSTEGGTYFFEDFEINYQGTVYLAPGDYWIDGDLTLDNEAQLAPWSAGTVRIFVNGQVEFGYRSGAATFAADQLLIYATDDIVFIDNEVNVGGFLYAEDLLETSYRSTVTGGVSGSTVVLGQDSLINYQPSALDSGDWGVFCGEAPPPPPPYTCANGGSLTSGLLGSYYDYSGQSFPSPPQPTGTPTGTRVDGPVVFDWVAADPGVAGVGADEFAVRWDGLLRVIDSGNYSFETVSDDGVRLWVDGVQVINNWTDHSSIVDTSNSITLAAGVYPIRLEFYENGGNALIHLRWDPPGSGTTSIPAGSPSTGGAGLYHCPGPPPMPALLAEYRMDEPSWNGTAGEVIDVSGNGRHGSAEGGANTDGATPAISGNPGTCRYGEFDGIDDYVEVSDLSSVLNGTASLAFWIKTTQTGNDTAWQAPGVTGVEEPSGTNDIFWGWLDASGRIGISVGNDFTTKSSVSVNDGTWRHVVLTRDIAAGNFKIYIDGNLNSSGSIDPQVIGNDYSSIGRIEDLGGTSEYFAGQLDEVRIYDDVLDDAQVAAVMTETHPCSDDFCPLGSPIGGMVGEYFNNMNLSGEPVGTRVDGPIDFNWGQNPPGVNGVNNEQFSVRWEGSLRVVESGNYRFRTVSDDGVRLWVDDVQIIDNWADHSSTPDTSGNVSLTAGQVYPIRLEYYENTTDAEIRLQWRKPGGGNSYVPIPVGPTPTLGEGLYHCPSGIPDHYTLFPDEANGITCEAELVTITARDASGAAMTPAVGTQIILSPAPDADTEWVGGPTYTFTGSETSVTMALRQTTPAIVDIHVTDGVASEIAPSQITFADVGLRFYGDRNLPNPSPLSNQVAGRADPSTVLRVVKTDDQTGTCVARLEDTSREVGLAYECRNPVTCQAGQTLTLAGAAVQGYGNGAPVSSYTPVTLSFDAQGFASIPLEYSDVGQVRLHGQLDLPAEGDDPGIVLRDSSSEFVVKPYTLAVTSVPGNPGGSGGFIAAGEEFAVQVEARNEDGNRTPNFGSEMVPETDIDIDIANLVYPAGGNTGSLSEGGAFTPVAGISGRFEATGFSWDEVGSITLHADLADNNYLEAGDLVATTESATVGRFYPYQYVLSDSNTDDSCGFFTYMGEPAITVDYQLEAQAAGGAVVGNYDAGLGYDGLAQVSYVAENSNNGTDLSGRASALTNVPWNAGVMDVTDTAALFARQSSTVPDGPYAQLQWGLVLTDSLDNRPLANLNMNPTTSDNCVVSGTCTAKMLGLELMLRYGRLQLADGFGPETAPLPVTFIAEYWDGSGWVVNTDDDSCTGIADTDITYTDMAGNTATLASDPTVDIGGGEIQGNYTSYSGSGNSVNIVDGAALTSFTAPGASHTGSFIMDVTSPSWLLFDWNQDGIFNDDLPPATFTFGSYRGHDRIIYWREVLQ